MAVLRFLKQFEEAGLKGEDPGARGPGRGRRGKALRSVAIADAPGGPIRLDKYGNPVHNIYIRRVERRGGRLQNTVSHTIESVSQFWNYPEAEFLKQPLYSREYPPCRFC